MFPRRSTLQRVYRGVVDRFTKEDRKVEYLIESSVDLIARLDGVSIAFYVWDKCRQYEYLAARPRTVYPELRDWLRSKEREVLRCRRRILKGRFKGQPWLLIPLRTSNEVRGIWAFHSVGAQQFDESCRDEIAALGQFLIEGHVLDRHRLSSEVRSHVEKAVGSAIAALQEGRDCWGTFLDRLSRVQELNVATSAIWLPQKFSDPKSALVLAYGYGWDRPDNPHAIVLDSGEGLVGKCFTKATATGILAGPNERLASIERRQATGMSSYAVLRVPCPTDGTKPTAAVLAVASSREWSQEDLLLLQEQMSLFGGLAHCVLMRQFMLRVFSTIQQEHDAYTSGHGQDVADLSLAFLKSIERHHLEPYASGLLPFRERIREIAALHDVGKLLVFYASLWLPYSYTPADKQVMSAHASWSGRVVSEVPGLMPLANAARWHHVMYGCNETVRSEKGYPSLNKVQEHAEKGLHHLDKDPAVLLSRVLAIADSMSAMTDTRSYKKRKSFKSALECLIRDEELRCAKGDCIEKAGCSWSRRAHRKCPKRYDPALVRLLATDDALQRDWKRVIDHPERRKRKRAVWDRPRCSEHDVGSMGRHH